MKGFKRHISTVLIWILLATIASPASAQAAGPTSYQEAINDAIVEKVEGLNDLSSIDILDFTLNDEPANLYLGLLQIGTDETHRQALEATSIISGYSIFTVQDIIEKDGGTDLNLPPAEAQVVISRIKSTYEEELLLAKLATDITASQFFFERYTNSIDDADFDLITDLQKIHELLFTEKPATFIESNPKKRNQNPFRDSHLGRLRELSSTVNKSQSGTPATPDSSDNSDSPQEEGTNQVAPVEGDEPVTDEGLEDTENMCTVDPELTAMIAAFNEQEAQANSQNNTDSNQDSGDQDSNTNNDNNSNDQSDGNGSDEDAADNDNDFVTRAIASRFQSGDDDFPCAEGEFFCVEIIKEFTRTKNYFPGDSDCTACRISRINQELTENVLKKNLSPGKVTGDFGELAECKEAYINLPLNLNISFEGKPIITKNKDLIKDLDQPGVRPKNNAVLNTLSNQSANQLIASRVTRSNANLTNIALDTQKRLDEIAVSVSILSRATSDSEKTNFYQSLNTSLIPEIRSFNQLLQTTAEQLTFTLRTLDEFISNPSCNG